MKKGMVMEEENKNVLEIKSVCDIIKKITGEYHTFEELDYRIKIKVFDEINNKYPQLKVYRNIGYNILNKKFFTIEYQNGIGRVEEVLVYYDNFSLYYDSLNGEIYNNACYYGYTFSNQEIKEYGIDLGKINFTSFVKKTVSNTTYRDLAIFKWDIETKTKEEVKIDKIVIDKIYNKDKFKVSKKWLDDKDEIVFKVDKEFDFVCDFIFYLDKDLSNADLLMCEGIENVLIDKSLDIRNIKVKGNVAKLLGISQKEISKDVLSTISFDSVLINEETTSMELNNNHNSYQDYYKEISYITDIHLNNIFINNGCITEEDAEYEMRKIIDEIEKGSNITLLGGDITSSFEYYNKFIDILHSMQNNYLSKNYFFTLGNHEFWGFSKKTIDEIIQKYRVALKKRGMFLVQNDLYYFTPREIKRISSEELESIEVDSLKKVLRDAKLIIFGGVGFSRNNLKLNADNGIYRGVISRETEIKEGEKFLNLYKKVAENLYDRNVIIFTHMPFSDWCDDDSYVNGFVYVSGHNHKNYFYDDTRIRIYSDNQIGYNQKYVRLKELSINYDYDWFSSYSDGIYTITRNDYIKFYQGNNLNMTFNRPFSELYMLKRNKTYMFLMKSTNGKLNILDGGMKRKTNGHNLEYYYNNLGKYIEAIKNFMSKYINYQEMVSSDVRSIGGSGCIHGCIVDIDFFNHLYINPVTGDVVPYYADSMTSKYVYTNIPSLLKNECPELYNNYQKYLQTTSLTSFSDDNQKVSKKKEFVSSTEMYKVSRIILRLQYLTFNSLIRDWNEDIFDKINQGNIKNIISGILGFKE